jgi:hypothetical protein
MPQSFAHTPLKMTDVEPELAESLLPMRKRNSAIINKLQTEKGDSFCLLDG